MHQLNAGAEVMWDLRQRAWQPQVDGVLWGPHFVDWSLTATSTRRDADRARMQINYIDQETLSL